MIRRNLRSREMKFPAKKRNKANLHRDRNSREVIYKSHDFANYEYLIGTYCFTSVFKHIENQQHIREISRFSFRFFFFSFFFYRAIFKLNGGSIDPTLIKLSLCFKIKYSFYHLFNILKVELLFIKLDKFICI